MQTRFLTPARILGATLAAALLASPAAAQATTRVSVDSAGTQGSGTSWQASISADGRFVAFESFAPNLVPNDTNQAGDVFVHDRLTGQVSRVSVDSAGVEGSTSSTAPVISADGRYVAFSSESGNLVPGDTNASADVFVHDRQTGQTIRVSVNSAGTQGNLGSFTPAISEDGRIVAFASSATNLVPGDANGASDVFVHDRQTGLTSRVSVSSAGVAGIGISSDPRLSADGHIVAFASFAGNLVPGDTNGSWDVFVHDRLTGETLRVSVSSAGLQGNFGSELPDVSADGLVLAFSSAATNLVPGDTNGHVDVFVHDRQTGLTSRVSVDSAGRQGLGPSQSPSVSGDGRTVAFTSNAENLVSFDSNHRRDVFVHDRQTGRTSRASLDSSGLEGNLDSHVPSISARGQFVAFQSHASNLVPGDTNGTQDVFVHDRDAASPNLSKIGTCPGPVMFVVTGATASGKVAIACGATGAFMRSTQPCAGVPLGVTPPALTTILVADQGGTAVLSVSPAAGLCGLSVQAVDLATCAPTNVIVL